MWDSQIILLQFAYHSYWSFIYKHAVEVDTYKSNFTVLLISVALSIIQFCLYAWVIFDFFKILPRFLETNVFKTILTN